MDSLALSTDWDLSVNSQGSIATVESAAAVAQNVASICRTFQGEAYYDTTLGIPYKTQVFGAGQQPSMLATLLEQAALTVADVKTATATLTTGTDRVVHGSINLTDSLITF